MGKKLNISDQRKAELKAGYGSIQPSNKDEQQYLNKIAAGRKRAATGIKDGQGRYITPAMKTEVVKNLAAVKGVESRTKTNRQKKVEDIIQEAGITDKELKTFYEINRETFDEMVYTGGTSVNRNSGQLLNDIENYKGKIYINKGGEGYKIYSKEEAAHEILRLLQYLKSNFSIVDFYCSVLLTFDGKMMINIPDYQKVLSELKEQTSTNNKGELNDELDEMDNDEVSELFNTEGFYIIRSNKKGSK